MKVWIMLPAFNEENSIPLMFPKIENVLKERELTYRIVVVEDGWVVKEFSDGRIERLEKLDTELADIELGLD